MTAHNLPTSHNGEEGIACLFPELPGNATTEKEHRTVEIDALGFTNLAKCAELYQTPRHLVLAGIWAVVLQRFTRSDHIRFAVIHEQNHNYDGRVYSRILRTEQQFSELTENKSWGALPLGGAGRSFNTAIFVLNNKPAVALTSNHLECRQATVINLVLTQQNIALEFCPKSIAATFAKPVGGAIAEALAHVLTIPHIKIQSINLFSHAQKQQVTLWQSAPMTDSEKDFFFDHVSLQTNNQPDAIAVESFDGQWTYGNLDRASSILAAQLQHRGVRSGVFVPVCFEKTCFAVLAMLAINKAGGAFVPCDPSHPTERLQQVVRRVQARLVLTSAAQRDLFARFSDLEVMIVSTETIHVCSLILESYYQRPENPESPAYVLFTSGSTGVPKACEISHRAFANISKQVSALHLTADTRALQFASFVFGMSIIEVFCTLAAGGMICMVSDEQRLNSLALTMSEMRINWALMTPTVLGSLRPQDLPYLRHLLIAGESLGEAQLRTWSRDTTVFQAFGLTEWTGIFAVSERIIHTDQRRTIGRPVNGHAWLVNPENVHVLAPIGAPGELVITGPALAAGYLGDQERTSAAFFADFPWMRGWEGLEPRSRVYKTGDILRYNPDGSLQYCGRKDHQVKIRGMRLELGEVESNILTLLPESKQAVAMVLDPRDSDERQILVAFVVLSPTIPATRDIDHNMQFVEMDAQCQAAVTASKRRLRDRLPDYMVPQYLLPVTAVPTTITGKVDRQKLAQAGSQLTMDDIQRIAGARQAEHRAPSTENERLVSEMVCEVLSRSSVGMQDNFFDLAGDSVAAMKMTGLARRRGVALTVADIFNRPVLADLTARLVQVEGKKKKSKATNGTKMMEEPFALLLQGGDASQLLQEVAQQTQLHPSRIVDAYPCTPLQEGLCALSAQDPTAYKARVVCQLQKGIDLTAVTSAWEQTVQSNDILRTRFVVSSVHGTIQAVVREEFEWDHARDLETYAARVSQESMGIGQRLVRACLITKGNQPAKFVLFIHHALCDRWSIRLLLEQMQAHLSMPGDMIHRPFRPFIEHILTTRSGCQEYWTAELEDIRASVFPELPAPGYSPNADQTSTFKLHLPERVARNIGTMATYVRLAWAIVLAHNTSIDEVVFGATVTGRGADLRGIEELSGPTIATLPLRVVLDREKTAADLLSAVQQQMVDLIPFEQAGLQNIQQYGVQAASACQFQNQLIIQPAWTKPLDMFPNCELTAATIGGFASYALCLECYVAADERHLDIVTLFDSKVIEAPRVLRLIAHLEYILGRILEQPHQPLSSWSRVSPHDLSDLLEWNAVVPPRPQKTVHGIIRSRTHKAPDALAICACDGMFTYNDLDRFSTLLASDLLRRGGRPGMIIPLLFEKGCWAIIAMMAVLKIGAGIAQLDPSYPLERIRSIYTQTGSPVILCSPGFAQIVEDLGSQATIVHAELSIWQQTPSERSLPAVESTAILYLIFTSGSTGEPKGLVVDHAAFIASAQAYIPEIQLDRQSRMLQFASVAFDAYYVEVFPTLMAGGCVCVPSDTERTNSIHSAMNKMQVTHTLFTPSYSRLVEPTKVPSLRVVWLIGEPVLDSDVAKWAPRVRLLNGYGPAECAAATATQHYDQSAATKIHPQDIGHPRGCVAWVCDPRNSENLVPIGGVGELLIEGPIVGSGYLNDPVKTAAAFPDPPQWLQRFRGKALSRVYKTGDLVRFHEDGRLRFIGRIGDQVKLRGQRIEPSHVEHHLLREFHRAVEVAVVVGTPKGVQRRPALVAFVLLADDQEDGDDDDGGDDTATGNKSTIFAVPSQHFHHRAGAAREKLQQILPDFMIPTLMIPITLMPRTNSGKLDRKRLKEEVASRTFAELVQYELAGGGDGDAVYRPSTDAEQELLAIWSRVLRIPSETIGVHQSFYHFGGDSITAMLVVSQARSGPLGLVVSVNDILRLRTIAQIAAQAEANCSSRQIQLIPDMLDTPFDLIPIQQLFFNANPHGQNRFSHNLLLHLKEHITPGQLEAAVEGLAKTHAMLRGRFIQSANGQWKQLISKEVKGSIGCRSHTLPDRILLDTIIAKTQKSLNITTGPVFAVDLINIGNEQAIFLIAHHLVVDMVSWTVLLADLEKLLRGRSIRPPLTSFQRWSNLLARRGRQIPSLPGVKTPGLDASSFWGVSEEANTLENAHDMVVQIDPCTTSALLGCANQAFGTQPIELLHAALLFSFTEAFPDRSPPTIFLEGHGREPWDASIDLTQTVGWFTIIAPVPAQDIVPGDLPAVVRACKDARRSLRGNGMEAAFTTQYYNSSNKQGVQKVQPMEIILNYAGRYEGQLSQTNTLFEIESLRRQKIYNASGKLRRWSIIDINALVEGGESLSLAFTFPKTCDVSTTLDPWISTLRKTLGVMATDFGAYPRSYTLSDFPLLDLDYEQLERLQTALSDSGIALDNIEGVYPCAPLQRGILLSQAKNPHQYHVVMSWQVNTADGPIDAVPRARAAVEKVIARHASLRTVFIQSSSGGVYDQVVLSTVRQDSAIMVVRSDAAGTQALPGAEEGDFQLSPGCPSRFSIYVSGDRKVYIRLDITHALTDARTLEIIQRELCLAYDGKISSEKAPIYTEYISFIREQDRNAARIYWDNYLDACEPCLFPMLTEHSEDGADQNHDYTFTIETMATINAYCKAHNVTAATVFSAAWALVLHSFVGSDHVCFGYLNSGRELPLPGASDIAGPLINVLTISTHLDDITAGDLLQNIHTGYLESLAHQTYPLADILHSKGMADTHLFNTVLSIQRTLPRTNPISSSSSTSLDLVQRHDPSEYAIALNIDIEETRTVIHLRHWLSTVSDQQALLIASSFTQAVDQIVANDQVLATKMDLVSGQHHSLLRGWNQTVPAAPSLCVHEFFQQRVLEVPQKHAVCTSTTTLSYRQLDRLSDSLACYLSQIGIGGGDFVPLCLEKSRWTVVALMGVMKTGAAFALLDATHPDQRLQDLCQDIGSDFILSSADQASRCTRLAKTVVTVGAENDAWRTTSRVICRPQAANTPNHALCLVFTSGSTGKPKGAILSHESFCVMASAADSLWRVTPSTRFAQFASYAFDAGLLEMLLPLTRGATTCILSEVERRDFLAETLTRLEVSHALLTPSVSRTITPAEVPYLAVLGSAGEPITQLDINRWATQVQLLNIYGPAECTVEAVCQANVTESSRPGDIGRPVGCVAWVVDPQDPERLLPVGALGELLLEGRIVGLGYLNNPNATQQAYINPPRWLRELRGSDSNVRVYRTGDLVRYRPDGQISIYGRKDTQIKIRGQRIELGEVEYQVHACLEGAQDVVVDLLADSGRPSETPRLFAFVCCSADTASSSADGQVLAADDRFREKAAVCSSKLFDNLPAYMVPSHFVPLAAIPLNPSGKANRKQLRAFINALSAEELQRYRPIVQKQAELSSPEEHLLQGIWADVLGLKKEHIGADVHFFQVGGDSVNAMRVAAKARSQGLDISVAHIFSHPRLSALAQAGRSQEMKEFQPKPFSLSPVRDIEFWAALLQARGVIPPGAGIVDILPTSVGQAFFLERPTLHHFTFQLDGELDVDRLRAACAKVYQHYSILRTVFVKYGDQVLQVVLDNVALPFHHIITDGDPAELNERLRVAERKPSPPLLERLVFAFILLSNPRRQTAQLLFRMSHAQWDGLSLGELFVPLREAWESKPLTPVTQLSTVMYYRAARDKSKSLHFWREYLQGSEITPLCRALVHEEDLDLSQGETIWENINLQPAPIPPPGTTMASVVKAAWALILAKERGTKDIVFGQTVNGRSSALTNIDNVLGCCLNFIPVRVQLQDSWSVQDLLQHAQAQYQKTVAHDDIEFQDIVDKCTSWAASTDLNTIVQHQNIPLTHLMPLGGLKTQFTLNGYFRPGRELFIFTEPDGDLLSVQFCVNPNMMEMAKAKVLHQRLVKLIVDLCQNPDESIMGLL
ncbi:hypothetical protein FE257_001910 [Aspergillus nanangensis]|uniref:Carrier domain-containing protein n=1 Tax=Aspergillus nanangensis TaxID=2582783 RepID=A0AAD4CD39_ASPNN|nr:hypothetical protein FE257_001910 [Aspergillus nanangensis]